MTFASAPWDARLVVIILRGGMDGLSVVQPWGDPNFAALRLGPQSPLPGSPGGPLDLDGFFALHPALESLMPLWSVGELGFVQAVSTPYRDKRSHFDGQDMLEAGSGNMQSPIRDGWLNRMLQSVQGIEPDTAYTVGRSDMLLTRGKAPVLNWAPGMSLDLSPQTQKLLELLMHDDPVFRVPLDDAIRLTTEDMLAMAEANNKNVGYKSPTDLVEMDEGAAMQAAIRKATQASRRGQGHQKLAEFTAEKLRGESRVAAFSLNGWDTHSAQDRTLVPALTQLSDVIATLREELGSVWERTAVLAMTEFGRTVQLNGSLGTDHGTAGLLMFAGGALRGGHIHGGWPGLAEADLYQRRDLMPLSDVRAHAAWVMHGLFGINRQILEQTVFPGLHMGQRSNLVI
jgi:uncharacterized protein (DUF1501 family)